MQLHRPLVLASSSPRRAELLRQIALPFEIVPPAVDESRLSDESAGAYVQRLSMLKAQAALRPGRLTLAADTIVVVDGQLLGKPSSQSEGVAMLQALGGRTHTVTTGVCLTDGRSAPTRVVSTEVTLKPITNALATVYWRTGEPADKAGGYGIQGIGSILVKSIRGSYSAVVGLPLAETEELLELFHFDPWLHRSARQRHVRRTTDQCQ